MNPELIIRKAEKSEVSAIVKLLSDDTLGQTRENFTLPIGQEYLNAFDLIDLDPNHELMVAIFQGELAACFQLNFLQYLTYRGGIRAQIEGVRVAEKFRSQGFGRIIFEYAIERSKSKGAHLLQLTTDKQRPDALRFYESLGFISSHEGMKLHFH